MNQRILFLIIALIIGLLYSSKAQEADLYTGSRMFWDINTQTTVFASGGYGRIIELQDGRLLKGP